MEITKTTKTMIEVTMSKRYMLRIQNGMLNPDCSQMASAYKEDLIAQGIIPRDNGDTLLCEIPSTISFLIRDFLFVLSLNGGIKYYTPWIQIRSDLLSDTVPVGVSNSEIDGRQKTWTEWIQPNYTILEHNGFAYFLSCAGTGNSLSDVELMLLWSTDGIDLVDVLPDIV